MTKRSATFEAYDVIVIPFPYTDNMAQSKRRPAVVLSEKDFNHFTGQLICAMITSAASSRWPHDIKIHDLTGAGLDKPCIIRMKLFTLDQRFVLRKAGALGPSDRHALAHSLRSALHID
jgi:mRNA interferase MazF